MPSTLFGKTAEWFERSKASLLGNLPCSEGCSGCCIGLFPVTILDRQEIQRGLPSLPEEQRKRIERIAAEQATALSVAAPQLSMNHSIDEWADVDVDRIIERFGTWPCPALEPDGTCGLYEFRPLACRSMGIPEDDGVCVSGACAVQTAVPLIRVSKFLREEENHLSETEANELEALRDRQGLDGEEILLPFAFLTATATDEEYR